MKTILKPLAFTICLLYSTLCYAHTSYPDTVKCPIDGQEFVIYVTMSYTSFGTFKDFQKHGAIGDLYESYVNSCPLCHYSGYRKDIDTSFDEKTKSDILLILEPYKQDSMTDVLENEIAVKLHQYFKKSNDNIANLYLVASYFLRNDSLQTTKRKELQKNCIEFLLKAVDAKEYKEKTYATIYYLIGDLYRRIGDFENSIKYFDLALNEKKIMDWLEKQIIEQKEMSVKKNDDNSI